MDFTAITVMVNGRQIGAILTRVVTATIEHADKFVREFESDGFEVVTGTDDTSHRHDQRFPTQEAAFSWLLKTAGVA